MKIIRYQIGTSLLEILISVVILALGLLGLAGLQVNSLQYQKTSSSRSEATQAAYDMGERIRTNWPLTTEANFSNERMANESRYNLVRTYADASNSASAWVTSCGVGSNCTPDALANDDFAGWINNLGRRLPGGAGSVSVVRATNVNPVSAFDVTVMWKEQGFVTRDITCPRAVSAGDGVRCITVRVTI